MSEATTQRPLPRTAKTAYAAIQMKHHELLQALARDVCADMGVDGQVDFAAGTVTVADAPSVDAAQLALEA